VKRFFETASIDPTPEGWQIRLDKAPVRTPAKAPLVLPTAALAEAIATEWMQQGDIIRPETMPLTRLANTARDLDSVKRAAVVDQIAGYAATDLLCYRAEGPVALVERQHRVWQPLLDWAALRYDAVLTVVTGLMPKPQAVGACRALRQAVEACDDWRLTVLQTATSACGSVIIGLALLEGRIDAEQAFAAAQLDETFQIEQWGSDPEHDRRRTALRAELEASRSFLRLLDGGGCTP